MYNAHGNQFAPPPFFSQPPSNASQPYPQGLQRPPPFAAHNANQRHFESNNHAPSPPVMPFQLPPNLNLEELKSIAARTGIPLPPPPIPPPHAFPPTFNHNAFTPPAQPQQNSQSYSYQHQSHPALSGAASSLGSQHQPSPLLSDVNRQELGVRQNSGQIPHNPTYPQIPGLDGASANQLIQASTSPTAVEERHNSSWNGRGDLQNSKSQQYDMSSVNQAQYATYNYEEVKAAVREMVSVGVTYQNLTDEGIAAPLLDKLFSDLGIVRDPPLKPSNQYQATAHHAAGRHSPTAVNHSIAQVAAAPQPDVPDPAMERKDRIAQLLAARKGQVVASNKSSQSASPAPVDVPQRQAGRSTDNTPKDTKTNVSDGSMLDAAVINTSRPEGVNMAFNPTNTTPREFEALPTPVREELQEQGFSIPGLFMTSGEGLNTQPLPVQIPTTTEIETRKRIAEPFASDALPHAKRQLSQPLVSSQVASTAIDPISTTQDSAPSSDPMTPSPAGVSPEKPGDAVTQITRSKINQDRLKNRMAALKADLLRKNSRKKTLQDGMPALNAEVEKTRERLSVQQSALDALRREITAKSSELDSMRQQEDSLVQEISRLELHLADGESGQQQFSHELTQLNDQIVADEQASHTSGPSTGAQIQRANSYSGGHGDPNFANPGAIPSYKDGRNAIPLNRAVTDTTVLVTPVRVQEIEVDPTKTPDGAVAQQLNAPQNDETASPSLESAAQISSPNSVSPDPADVPTAPASEEGQVDDSDDDAMSIDEASDAESGGSVSMSDSSSEYEPALDHHTSLDQQNESEEVDEYEPDEAVDRELSTENDNDDYEPAEQVDVLNVDNLDDLRDAAESIEKTPASLNDLDPIAGEAEAELLEQTYMRTSAQSTRTGSADLRLSPIHPIDTDLTPVETPSAMNHSPIIIPNNDDPHAVPHYSPYESPLANFKSFRFHPRFIELVKDGYRSLTYSNRIDPKRPLCQTELQGQTCTDVDCDYQHFGSMALSDDKILVQMSSANDIRDKAQRDQYLLGLKKVIADLRAQGVKEFSEVANALSKYRREWMSQQDGIVT